jgi:hypothetical protein
MVRLMSDSLERRLTIGEHFRLRLHLLVCAWCAQYLKQIKFLRWALRARSAVTHEQAPSLSAEARERIARTLQNRDR